MTSESTGIIIFPIITKDLNPTENIIVNFGRITATSLLYPDLVLKN